MSMRVGGSCAQAFCGSSKVGLLYDGADFVSHMSAHMSHSDLITGFGNARSAAVVKPNSKDYRVI